MDQGFACFVLEHLHLLWDRSRAPGEDWTFPSGLRELLLVLQCGTTWDRDVTVSLL